MVIIFCVIAVLVPAAILAVGIWWRVSPPPFRSKGFAYATALSSASPEAWAFAHHHCSRLWIRVGAILLVLAAGILAVFPDSVSSYVLWLIGGEMALFCLSAFLVDLLLKSSFREDGTPIK